MKSTMICEACGTVTSTGKCDCTKPGQRPTQKLRPLTKSEKKLLAKRGP